MKAWTSAQSQPFGFPDEVIPRGTIVVTALPGEYGNPLPALVVQSGLAQNLGSSVVCPLTSYEGDGAPLVRVRIQPTAENGLEKSCFVMVDKIIAMPTSKLQRQIGFADEGTMDDVSGALLYLLGLA